MTWLDHFLQRRRIAQARPFLPPGARVLDIGSANGALFLAVDFLGAGCMGIDPTLRRVVDGGKFKLFPGFFPQDMPAVEPFDVVTMLAVLEHFPASAHAPLAEGCRRFLKPAGRVIITVPSPRVDHILALLQKLRLVHGMALEEHHGYEVRHTLDIFCAPHFRLVGHHTFQFGLNNLFVFEKSATPIDL
jgi:2-polyprenyl-3-methyl-5-hydroxy-6-metoxy-1,4-benzoquinol methylase